MDGMEQQCQLLVVQCSVRVSQAKQAVRQMTGIANGLECLSLRLAWRLKSQAGPTPTLDHGLLWSAGGSQRQERTANTGVFPGLCSHYLRCIH